MFANCCFLVYNTCLENNLMKIFPHPDDVIASSLVIMALHILP